MLVLGIESAGPLSSVALVRAGNLVGDVSLVDNGRPHTNRIATAVQQLFQTADITPRQIELLAVNAGPGSFTGLRIGLTFAKTFAYVTGCPLVRVESFTATVHPIPRQPQAIEVVEDLRQGFVAWQQFRWHEQRWQPAAKITAEPFAAWAGRSKRDIALTGAGLKRLQRQMPDKTFPADWHILPAEFHHPTALAVAAIGPHQLAHTGPEDPFTCLPLYIRRSAAEERADTPNTDPTNTSR